MGQLRTVGQSLRLRAADLIDRGAPGFGVHGGVFEHLGLHRERTPKCEPSRNRRSTAGEEFGGDEAAHISAQAWSPSLCI